MLYPFAPHYVIEDNGHLVLAARRGQQENRPSDDLLRRIPEDRFGSLIPACNRPAQVCAYDSVIRGFDDSGGRLPIIERRRIRHSTRSVPLLCTPDALGIARQHQPLTLDPRGCLILLTN